MKKLALPLAIVLIFLSITINAQGPKQIAKIDRKLWPYAINTPSGFDYASKMEMLVFVEMLEQQENLVHQDSLKKYLGLKSVEVASVNEWKSKIKKIIVQNFSSLASLPASDYIKIPPLTTYSKIAETSKVLSDKMPDTLRAWYANAKMFYNSYIYEQMRLAALFPKTTSEILTMHNSEITGYEYKDKHFLLTFDDGPSASNGSTDKLILTLQRNNVNGVFFVLGDVYNNRLKVTSAKQLHDLYGNNIVGSHGMVHKSHQRYEDWQLSLDYTSNIIDSIIPENKSVKYFRPPYGQRHQNVIAHLNNKNTRVMLWNIDSQDWNAKISSAEVADRMITLMLLWRRGILLFHDIHPKANVALPVIWKELNAAGIVWQDAGKLE